MSIQPPAISQLSRAVPVEIRRAIESIGGFLQEIAKQGGLPSVRDMQRAGVADVRGNFTPPLSSAPLPPALTNFEAHSGFSSILLTWDDPRYAYLSHVEVYRATVDDLGQAVLIGTSRAPMYADTPPNNSLSATYYYWARVVGSPPVYGPFNATAGTPGSTASDPTYLLEVLTGNVTAGQLHQDLTQRIDKIDAPGTGLIDMVNELAENQLSSLDEFNTQYLRVLDHENKLNAIVTVDPNTGEIQLLATANVTTDIEARLTAVEFDLDAAEGQITSAVGRLNAIDGPGGGLEVLGSSIDQLAGEVALKVEASYVDQQLIDLHMNATPEMVDGLAGEGPEATLRMVLLGDKMNRESLMHKANIAQAQFDIKANSSAIEAEATARLQLVAQIDDVAADLVVEQTARASGDAAEAQARALLAAQVGNNAAAILAEQTARANGDAAEAQARAALEVQIEDNAAAILAEQTARANGDAAEAQARAALAAQVEDNAAAILAEQTARANADGALSQAIQTVQTTVGDQTAAVQTLASSVDGIEAEYTIKAVAGGIVSGVGLINGPAGSEFGVLANRFWVMFPNAPAYSAATTYKSGARVSYGTKTVDGQVVPVQWRCTTAITVPEAWNPAHWDSANLSPFIVDMESGVVFDTAYFKEASIKSAHIETVTTDKLRVAGTANIWEAIINLGKITNAYIGDTIQSNNYEPGTVGWIINKAGNIEVYNLKARGDIEATSLGANKAVGTANIQDAAVDTLQIKGNAVTIPASWWNAGTIRLAVAAANVASIPSFTLPQAGRLHVNFSASLDIEVPETQFTEVYADLYINGILEQTFTLLGFSAYVHTVMLTTTGFTYSKSVAAGSYAVTVYARVLAGSGGTCDCSQRSLLVQGAMR